MATSAAAKLTRAPYPSYDDTTRESEGSNLMSNMQIPSDEHPGFDQICSEVEDFEPLPTVTPVPAPPAEAREQGDEERTAPLDELILAGLVSP
jgi:hypothetical protein